MDHLSSCYFCSSALDESLGTYAVSGDAGETAVTLCSTCQRKLDPILDTTESATIESLDTTAGDSILGGRVAAPPAPDDTDEQSTDVDREPAGDPAPEDDPVAADDPLDESGSEESPVEVPSDGGKPTAGSLLDEGESTAEDLPTEETSIEESADETPIEESADETPIEESADETPIEESADETPIEESADETPIEESADETPIEESADETPIENPTEEDLLDDDPAAEDPPSDGGSTDEEDLLDGEGTPGDEEPADGESLTAPDDAIRDQMEPEVPDEFEETGSGDPETASGHSEPDEEIDPSILQADEIATGELDIEDTLGEEATDVDPTSDESVDESDGDELDALGSESSADSRPADDSEFAFDQESADPDDDITSEMEPDIPDEFDTGGSPPGEPVSDPAASDSGAAADPGGADGSIDEPDGADETPGDSPGGDESTADGEPVGTGGDEPSDTEFDESDDADNSLDIGESDDADESTGDGESSDADEPQESDTPDADTSLEIGEPAGDSAGGEESIGIGEPVEDSPGEPTGTGDSIEADDSAGADGPTDTGAGGSTREQPAISALEYNKVMRLLQNHEFPVERGEVVTAAANAYELSEAHCTAVIDLAIDRGLLAEEDGVLVQAE